MVATTLSDEEEALLPNVTAAIDEELTLYERAEEATLWTVSSGVRTMSDGMGLNIE